MSSTTRPVYRVFLSSTAIDLKEYRQKVQDAILTMGGLPVAMESFGAQPSEPLDVCKKKVRECDALCVFLAHRYGWVPSIEDGGDGHKSITWIEVDTALEEGIPVFAFVVDEKHGWSQPKEQDLLKLAESDKDAIKVFEKVKALKEFRRVLENQVRETFTTPDNLATKVVASLSKFAQDQDSSGSSHRQSKQRIPIFREVHPLQPATHFRGRKKLLKDLTKWWNDPLSADRVISLIAIGGMGKTALIAHFLSNYVDKTNQKGSVLVWSFYENPNTDAFLAEALNVFAGESEDEQGIGGRLPRLQRALSKGDKPHLLVLDGLERVQSEGTNGKAWGDLENHRIKNLLRSIAGGLGKTRAIITSRFKITDLAQWEHRGYKGIDLETLNAEGAVHLLRAWQVDGDDAELQALAESLGRHALSVSVLGSYLKNYYNGDILGAAQFKLDDATKDDSQAAKLGRILGGYAKNLSNDERDLLIRMSIFPRGISVEILKYIIAVGGEIAGTLVGVTQPKLLRLAKRLETLGLVYTYNLRNSITYTAHPFLREYFRKLLGVASEKIHEVVRGQLAVGLETKPDNKPTDTQTLDRYEDLIEQTILAGHVDEAYDLFFNVMGGTGGQSHLFHKLGDYGRIIRVLSLFSENGQPEMLGLNLSIGRRSFLINYLGFAAGAQGDLVLTDRCFKIGTELDRKLGDMSYLSQGLQNSANLAISQGAFLEAKKLILEAIEHTQKIDENIDKYIRISNIACLAFINHTQGEILESQHNFKKAKELEGEPLYSISGIAQAEHLFSIGQKDLAFELTESNLATCEEAKWPQDISLCNIQLGLLSLPNSITKARYYLYKTRQWTDQSGHMECIIRAHRLAAEIAVCSGDLDTAISEANTGLNQAKTCGYGQFAIDLLIQLARINLAVPDPRTALVHARRALDWSSKTEVMYAWGIADAAELCGKCHEELGEHDLAARRFKEAEIARKPLRLESE